MEKNLQKIGLGGGCHWCTEAVYSSLKGIHSVGQGWISSNGQANTFSEAVLLVYDPEIISLQTLIEIHLRTHQSTSRHTMRDKYRSAIYVLNAGDRAYAEQILADLQQKFDHRIITRVLDYAEFLPSREEIRNYYYSNPEKPFCKAYIDPKLRLLLSEFSEYTKPEQLDHLKDK